MTKTYSTKQSDIKREWHLIDADDRVLGNLASEIAVHLLGKNKPTYTPTLDMGDCVVVINAEKVALTGNKMKGKEYKWHTGFPGGIRSETVGSLLERRPTEVLRRAVYGMLPKNKLRKHRIQNLYIYAGPENPHVAQFGKQNNKDTKVEK